MLTILRGAHCNERVAYEAAGQVYDLLKDRAECRLLSIPRERTMWGVFDNWKELAAKAPRRGGSEELWKEHDAYTRSRFPTPQSLDEAFFLHDKLHHAVGGHVKNEFFLAPGTDRYTFHNYAIKGRYPRPFEPLEWLARMDRYWTGRVVWDRWRNEGSLKYKGEVQLIAVSRTRTIVEFPAVFDWERPTHDIKLLHVFDEKYLHDASRQATIADGLFDEALVRRVAEAILGHHLAVTRRPECHVEQLELPFSHPCPGTAADSP